MVPQVRISSPAPIDSVLLSTTICKWQLLLVVVMSWLLVVVVMFWLLVVVVASWFLVVVYLLASCHRRRFFLLSSLACLPSRWLPGMHHARRPHFNLCLSLSLVYFHQSCHVIDVSSFYHVIFSCVSSPVFVSSFHLCLMSSLLCISCLCIISCPCVISSYLSCHFSLFPPWTLLSLSRLLLAWILC